MADKHVWQHVSLAVKIILQMNIGIFIKMIHGLIVQMSSQPRARNFYFVLISMMTATIQNNLKKLEMTYCNFAFSKAFILS